MQKVLGNYVIKIKYNDAIITMTGQSEFDTAAKIMTALVKEGFPPNSCGGCGDDKVKVIETKYIHPMLSPINRQMSYRDIATMCLEPTPLPRGNYETR